MLALDLVMAEHRPLLPHVSQPLNFSPVSAERREQQRSKLNKLFAQDWAVPHYVLTLVQANRLTQATFLSTSRIVNGGSRV